MSSYSSQHLAETAQIVQKLDPETLEKMADLLADIRNRGGRLFFLGVGGSAANASHAVNDFRKIAGLECYAPTDNVSELTARTNDEGWASVFVEWLKGSRLQPKDALMIFSVGGGNLEKNVSPNLVSALQYAKEVGASVLGIVGRDGGYTAKVADACCIVPTVNSQNVTPHSEAFQGSFGIFWFLIPNSKFRRPSGRVPGRGAKIANGSKGQATGPFKRAPRDDFRNLLVFCVRRFVFAGLLAPSS